MTSVACQHGGGFEPLSLRHGTGSSGFDLDLDALHFGLLEELQALSPATWAQRLACFHGRSCGLPTTTAPLGRLSRTTVA